MPPSNSAPVLEQILPPWPALERRLDALIGADDGVPEDRVRAAMRHAALTPGKRVRAHLVRMSAALFGLSAETTLPLATAIELLHAYSLVHDDLPAMDNADRRRGQPSVHKAYDEVTAILAGDGLQALAFEALSLGQPALPPGIVIELVRMLAQAAGARGMVAGQMLDLLAEKQALLLDVPDLRRLQANKTGALLRFACEGGAVLAAAGQTERAALRDYGAAFGVAYQLVDDLLDATGDPEKTGKPQLDARAGKANFVHLWGQEQSLREVKRLVAEAQKALDPIDADRQALRDLAASIMARQQ